MKNSNMRNVRLGTKNTNHQGLNMVVVDYINSHNVIVKFDDGSIIKTEWREFINGSLNNPNYKEKGHGIFRNDRLGEKKLNNQGCLMEIVKYNNANDIIVQFDNIKTNIIHSIYSSFKSGNINNPLYPSVYGIGITGNECPCMNGKDKLKEYRTWVGILERCTKNNQRPRSKAYKDCTVSDEFLYYPNFYKWITSQENYQVWKNTPNFAVDKDILCKGNKTYSPDKCCLVPNRINNLIKLNKARRGNELIGITKSSSGKYIAQCWNGVLKKNIRLGVYDNDIDAFIAYKQYKENLIKSTAETEYKNGVISKACRDALLKYEVEITD